MAHYQLIGDVPHKRHTQHRTAQGGLYYEELMGEEGFSSDSSLLYHRGLPSAISQAESWELGDSLATTPNHPLLPRHLKRHDLFVDGAWRGVGAARVLGPGVLPQRPQSPPFSESGAAA